MPYFRKKPVIVEAHQWHKNGDHPGDFTICINGERTEGSLVRRFRSSDKPGSTTCQHCYRDMGGHGWVDTLEGGHIVCPGDWIITGVSGEHYPCKPNIFNETYEHVPSPEPVIRDVDAWDATVRARKEQ